MQRIRCGKKVNVCRSLILLIALFLMGCGPDTMVPSDGGGSLTGTGQTAVTGSDIAPETAVAEPEEQLVTIERDAWISAYKDYIRNVDVNGAYELIYLNNDEVPEVVYQSDTTSETRTIVLYSYCEDETGGYVISGYIGFDCGVPRYIPKEGYIVCQSRDYRDMDSDYVCLLSKGKIRRLFKGVTFKDDTPFLFNVVTEEYGNEDIHSFNDYNRRMHSVFDRFLDLIYCGNGTYSSEEALWEAMEQTPETVSCIRLVNEGSGADADNMAEQKK